MPTPDPKARPHSEAKRAAMLALIWAGLCEALCVIAGLIAFWLTGKNTWIAIGIVAGLGFSLPAAIRYYREVKERNRASR